MLTNEEIKSLKAQLSSQIQHLPEAKRKAAQAQIDSLSPQALEAMISEQKERSSSKQPNKGIFRLIVDKEIPSKIITETKDALVVLDIKPVSRGHLLIIPKKAVSDSKLLPSSLFNLAKKLSKRISSKLKSTSTEIQTESKFGETLINVIPIYDSPLNLNSPRLDLEEKELEATHSILKIVNKPKSQRIKKEQKESSSNHILKLNRRIP